MNDARTAFKENFSLKFKINDIPIEAGVTTTSSRRKINGYCINKDELARVLRRASCNTDLATYNKFVESVSRMSFLLHDILANGLPVKTYVFDSDQYGKDANYKHPKIRFEKDGSKFYVLLQDGTKYKVERISEFVKRCQSTSRKATGGYTMTHEGKYVQNGENSCEIRIRDVLLPDHVPTMNQEARKQLMKEIKKEREQAEEKAKKLLADVAKMVGATQAKLDGKDGYTVKGSRRTYFIETETLKVHDFETKRYVCVVNGKGDQGVGMDALVGRLLALKNDERVAHKITTLH